jgi:hypothetical protein
MRILRKHLKYRADTYAVRLPNMRYDGSQIAVAWLAGYDAAKRDARVMKQHAARAEVKISGAARPLVVHHLV